MQPFGSRMLLRQAGKQVVTISGRSATALSTSAPCSCLKPPQYRRLASLLARPSQPYLALPALHSSSNFHSLASSFSTSSIRLNANNSPKDPSPAASSASEASSSLSSSSSPSSPSIPELPTSTGDDTSNLSRPEKEDPFTAAASEELLNAPSTSSPSRQAIGKIDRRLSITFTCTVPKCGHRSTHEFSRHAYEKGIVLVQCPGCSSRHLIADHLGWFNSDDLTQGGKYKTIEALLAAKGEQVARASVLPDGTVEVDVPDEEEQV